MSNKCAEYIRLISLGKYTHKLYHKGESQKATLCSGILTIIFLVILIGFGLKEFIDIYNLKNYNMSQNIK